jgi:hypothetical protein
MYEDGKGDGGCYGFVRCQVRVLNVIVVVVVAVMVKFCSRCGQHVLPRSTRTFEVLVGMDTNI